MMEDVTLDQAKEHLEELLEKVARGEDVRITDARLGSVRLVPAEPHAVPPRGIVFGQWAGRMPEIPPERLLAPLSEDELTWLSGEADPVF
jgi:prevent-host-death family protein